MGKIRLGAGEIGKIYLGNTEILGGGITNDLQKADDSQCVIVIINQSTADKHFINNYNDTPFVVKPNQVKTFYTVNDDWGIKNIDKIKAYKIEAELDDTGNYYLYENKLLEYPEESFCIESNAQYVNFIAVFNIIE